MRLLVCGGRAYRDRARVFATLSILHLENPITCIIHGNAGQLELVGDMRMLTGADRLAGEWADLHKILVEVYKADWQKYGKIAGHIRNESMLRFGRPDKVLGFPGHSGTWDMLTRAHNANVPIMCIGFEYRGGPHD